MANNVLIGSARIDERGKSKGGKAGDQTGKEVSTQLWYKHQKGWVVLRPKSTEIANLIADDMKAACANNNIGYDQGQRNISYNIAAKVGFNCALITEKCETDCSELVRICCAYAGIRVKDFNTTTEAQVLMNTGHFVKLVEPKYCNSYEYLKRGDILVTKTQGHTVVVLNNGPKAARDGYEGIVYVTGESVFIRKGPGKEYNALGLAHLGDYFMYADETKMNWNKIFYGAHFGWISGKFSELR